MHVFVELVLNDSQELLVLLNEHSDVLVLIRNEPFHSLRFIVGDIFVFEAGNGVEFQILHSVFQKVFIFVKGKHDVGIQLVGEHVLQLGRRFGEAYQNPASLFALC